MQFANHMLVGAALALAVPQPVIALPLALVSHFALDSLPHFGYNREGLGASLSHRTTYFVQGLSLVGIVLLLSILPPLHWLIILAMLLSIAPDFDWIYKYVYFLSTKHLPPSTTFDRFHRRIQWCERQWGVMSELLFFIVGFLLLRHYSV